MKFYNILIFSIIFYSSLSYCGQGGGGGPRMDKLIIKNIDSIRTNENNFVKPTSFAFNNIKSIDILEIYLKNGNVLSRESNVSIFLESIKSTFKQ